MPNNQLIGLVIVLWALGVFGPTSAWGWLGVILYMWLYGDHTPTIPKA